MKQKQKLKSFTNNVTIKQETNKIQDAEKINLSTFN